MTTLNDVFECKLTLEDGGWGSGSKSLSIPTPLHRVPHLYHVSAHENLSFIPATPRAHSPQQPNNLTTVCHCLKFEEDDNSSLHGPQWHFQHPRNDNNCQ